VRRMQCLEKRCRKCDFSFGFISSPPGFATLNRVPPSIPFFHFLILVLMVVLGPVYATGLWL
jgi:hypothetical protein